MGAKRIGHLFLAIALVAPLAAQATVVKQRLAVSATVVASCRLEVRVPKVGSQERAHNGVGAFSVKCSRTGRASTEGMDKAVHEPRSGEPPSQVHMVKGFTASPRLDEPMRVADYSNTMVTEVLF